MIKTRPVVKESDNIHCETVHFNAIDRWEKIINTKYHISTRANAKVVEKNDLNQQMHSDTLVTKCIEPTVLNIICHDHFIHGYVWMNEYSFECDTHVMLWHRHCWPAAPRIQFWPGFGLEAWLEALWMVGEHCWLLRCLSDTTECVGVAPMQKGTLLVSHRKYLYVPARNYEPCPLD